MATSTLTDVDELTIVKMLAGGRSVEFVTSATGFSKAAVEHALTTHAGRSDSWAERLEQLGAAADRLQSELDERRRGEMKGASLRYSSETPAAPTPVPSPSAAPKPVAVAVQPASTRPKPSKPAPAGLPATIAPEPATIGELLALVDKALASEKQSTRAKGRRLQALFEEVRQVIADEAADRARADREKAERDAALQEIAQLEAQLEAAKAKLGKVTKAGPGTGKRQESAAQIAARATRQERQRTLLERFGITRTELAEWGRLNGHDWSGRGAFVPVELLDAYEAAHA